MTELSDRLRAERTRAGLSQTALAGDDFSPSYISLIEAGRRVPTDAALGVLARRLGTTAEYLRFGDRAPSEERARLEIGFAQLALVNGEAQEARDRLLALDLGSIAPRHHVEALHTLARAHEALGDLDECVAVLEPLLADARADHRWLDAAVMGCDLVAAYHEAGDLGHSIALGEALLEDVEAAGIAGTDEHLRLGATLLWSYYERGDLLFATHRASELIAIAEAKGTMRGRGSIYWNASLVAEGRGDLAEARRLTERALAYLSEGAASRDVPRLRLHFGWLLLRCLPAEPEAALAQLDEAAAGLAVVGSEIELARCEFEQGRAWLMLGDADRAESLARGGLSRLEDQAALDICNGNILLGDVFAARGEVEQARETYQWAGGRLAMMAAGRSAAAIWRALGDRLLSHGDTAGAAQAFDAALRDAGIYPTAVPSVVVPSSAAAGFSGAEH
ncbi:MULTISPECIES: helix-turn-helix transcriptional regulator [unclassified Actinotalea]|uniref:helix-turn-helix transcriptional regulator n=1 Tax=unclassified Actinotalea TaxID=2638618 RepID=UPI0015F51AB5|nr:MULTISPECIES: helix-turn-helix transcriptional regulator [unclassified Actinotalea]